MSHNTYNSVVSTSLSNSSYVTLCFFDIPANNLKKKTHTAATQEIKLLQNIHFDEILSFILF